MRTRQARAAANRAGHHQRRLQRASTDRARLRAACAWLVAEAVRAGRADQATRAVLELVCALPRDTAADHLVVSGAARTPPLPRLDEP